ncbi:MAG TPA: adenylate/guanylate cyclase domain-containing protein [Anaerolineae bacterium]|nr:adenylate/guanylate cyclase domain-containing protein [Anaerolineae bacterium]
MNNADRPITCPQCQHPNRSQARFCDQCGTRLLICQQCATPLRAEARFCDHCGTPVPTNIATTTPQPNSDPIQRLMPQQLATKLAAATQTQSISGERRIVTILFCDVKGSTAMAGQLDPEEWSEIMNRAFDYLITPVYRFEGTVVHLMGDAILAFFGAPIAHEDDPQRAILAGLAIADEIQAYRAQVKQKWGLDFDVRVGINTGLVVVGAMGSDMRMTYTALGDAVNLAARMEQTAQPGTVQITAATYRLVAPLFDVEHLGPLTIKGKDDPIPAYRVIAPKAHPGRLRGITGLNSPLIGRDDQLNQLQQAARQLDNGHGHIICLIGEAGLGKSRLTAEFRRWWHAEYLNWQQQNHHPHWQESRGISFDTAQAYGQFQQHLTHLIEESTPADDTFDNRLTAFLNNFPDETWRQQAHNVIPTLLSADKNSNLTGDQFTRELITTLTTLYHQWAHLPSVLVFDDLHWADVASIQMIKQLWSLITEVPLLFICVFRPEQEHPCWSLTSAAAEQYPDQYSEIQLTPLTNDDAATLVDSLLTVSDLPPAIRNIIIQKTDGNPFFVEEVLRNLIDEKLVTRDQTGTRWHITQAIQANQIIIPDNIQTLLMARIDRLPDDVRQTIQIAAVIGRRFQYQLLQTLVPPHTPLGQHLQKLQKAQLIRESTSDTDTLFMFRHVLTQEAAYNTILLKQRREFHNQVGHSLLNLYAHRLDEFASTLAYHFNEAENYEKAIHYYIQAGDTAFRLYATNEALTHYHNALQLTATISLPVAEWVKLYQNYGRCLELENRYYEAIKLYQQMRTIGEDKQLQPLIMHGLIGNAQILSITNPRTEWHEGKELLEKALPLALDIGDKETEVKIYWTLMNLYRFDSSLSDVALQYGQKALAMAREFGFEERLAYVLNDLSHVYVDNGRFDLVMPHLEEATPLWRQQNNQPMLTDNLNTISFYSVIQGNYQRAIETATESFAISSRINNTWGQAYSQSGIGIAYWDMGYLDKAFETMEAAYQYGRLAHFGMAQILPMITLAACAIDLQWEQRARQALATIEPLLKDEWRYFQLYYDSAMLRLHLSNGNLDEARKLLNPKIFLQDAQPAFAPIFAIAHLTAAITLEEFPLAQQLATRIGINLERAGAHTFFPELNYWQGTLYWRQGFTDKAQASWENGIALAQQIGSHRYRWRTANLLADIAQQQDQPEKVAHWHQIAQTSINTILERTQDTEIKKRFKALPTVQHISKRKIT